MADYQCNLCDKVYVRKKCLENHMKSKHDEEIVNDQEDQELRLGLGQGLVQGPVVQWFNDLEIPEDFPEMEVLLEVGEELDLEEAAEAAENEQNNDCGKCDNLIKDNKRVIKRMKALEKSKNYLQKLCKGQESELIDCRERLGIVTKERVRVAENEKTKKALEEVTEAAKSDEATEEDACEALFPCGQDITEGEKCNFATNTQKELLTHYKHFHEIKCNKCKCIFNSLTELRKHDEIHAQENKWHKCDFCDGYFHDKKSLTDHIKNAHHHSNELKLMGCGHCDFETNVKSELMNHIMSVHSETDSVSCNQCNYKTGTKAKLEGHIKTKHSQNRPVCKFFLEGKCTRAMCTFRHEKPETLNHKSDKIKCKRGSTCNFKAQNKCFYYHPVNEVQVMKETFHSEIRSQGPHEIRSQTLWCKYQDACNKNQCPFRHFQVNKNNQPQKRGPMFM